MKTKNIHSYRRIRRKKIKSRIIFLKLPHVRFNALFVTIAVAFMICRVPIDFRRIDICKHIVEAGVAGSLYSYREPVVRPPAYSNAFVYLASAFMDFPMPQKQNNPLDNSKITAPKLPRENPVAASVEIKNETDFSVDALSVLSESVVVNNPVPKVLIVHTHGSESYTPDENYHYTHSGNYRTQDTRFNMIRIGEELKKALELQGIQVIHDKTINDYPSYNDSYNKAGKIIKEHIAKDPAISFVFDIHRDAVGNGDNAVKFNALTEKGNTARAMIVCGSNANLENPLWQENLRLGVHIQSFFNAKSPGFLRPLNLRKERFNMHLTTGSLLFEVGTCGNTLDEALRSAALLGEGLGEYINLLTEH